MAAIPEVAARLGEPKKLENVSEDELKAILKEYYDKWGFFIQTKIGSANNLLFLPQMGKFWIGKIWHWVQCQSAWYANPPTGDGGHRHERKVHPAQAKEGSQLQAHGRRRVMRHFFSAIISSQKQQQNDARSKKSYSCKMSIKWFDQLSVLKTLCFIHVSLIHLCL